MGLGVERGRVPVLGDGMGPEQVGGRVRVGGEQEPLGHPKPSGKQRQRKPLRVIDKKNTQIITEASNHLKTL